ncbi:SDR family NAD(P)-dependent oxidoreductase, partial [Mycobacterium tuberculosis]
MSINKTVIVTGASSGIGLGLVKAFLDRGYNVVGNARSGAGLDDAAARLGHPSGFIGVVGDIADPSTSTALVAKAIEV